VKSGAEGIVAPPVAPPAAGVLAGAGALAGAVVDVGVGEGMAVPPVDSAGAPGTSGMLPRIARTIGVAANVSRRRKLLPFISADGVS
jgi:hypothetical protein